MPENVIELARRVRDRATAYMRDRRKCAQIRRDLESMGVYETRRVLAEFQLTPKEVEGSLRVPFASEDMFSRALCFLGVDAQRFQREHGDRSREMRRTCFMCPAKARCRRDLMAGRFGQNYHAYCPNRLHFAVLLSRKAHQGNARV